MSVYCAEFLKHIREHLSILGECEFICCFFTSFFSLVNADEDPVPVSFHHNGYLLCGSEKSVALFEENYKTQT
jgi:hypothetical protein